MRKDRLSFGSFSMNVGPPDASGPDSACVHFFCRSRASVQRSLVFLKPHLGALPMKRDALDLLIIWMHFGFSLCLFSDVGEACF